MATGLNINAPQRPVAPASTVTTRVPPPADPRLRSDPVRAQYLELKANVHRKLLNRLNLEALATADRARAESEIKTLLFELIAEEGTPVSLAERAQGDSAP